MLQDPTRVSPSAGERDTGLLGQLAHGRLGVGLAGLEAAARERPLLGRDRRVLVALLHQQTARAVDQGGLGEAHGTCGEAQRGAVVLTVHEAGQGRRGRVGQRQLAEGGRVDEDDAATFVALDVGVGQVDAGDEHVDRVGRAVGLVEDRQRRVVTQRAGREHEARLLLELAVGACLGVLAVVEVTARQPPALGVDHRVLVPLLEQDPPPAVDEEDVGEAGHPATVVPPGLRAGRGSACRAARPRPARPHGVRPTGGRPR